MSAVNPERTGKVVGQMRENGRNFWADYLKEAGKYIEELEARLSTARTGQEIVETTLKLYVWENFAPDFSSGIAFALARDSEEARDMIAAGENDYLRMYLGAKPLVYEWGTVNTPFAFFVTGSS